VKLWIDARTAFPNTPAGYARRAQLGPSSKIEVLDAAGQWVLVPPATAYLSPSKEARRPFVLDISNIFVTSNYRVRLSWLFKTFIDAILVDVSADVPVALTLLSLETAELRYYGHSHRSGGELVEFTYGAATLDVWPAFPGHYTRYGHVTALLSAIDDKHVISWAGDELALRFTPPAAPPPGIHRRFILHSFGYYKNAAAAGPQEVEPLPFAGMSNYPYDSAVESYPDDPVHETYRQIYNTRVLP